MGPKRCPCPCAKSSTFALSSDDLRRLINERTALIILNSPHNPTGGILERDDLAAIAELCAERNIPVLSDEVYEQILYDGEFTSIATYPGMSTRERTIILHGFSKTYAMTGWRLGYGVMPEWLAEHSHAADGQLELVHERCNAVGRRGRPHRNAGAGGADGRSVPSAARGDRTRG